MRLVHSFFWKNKKTTDFLLDIQHVLNTNYSQIKESVVFEQNIMSPSYRAKDEDIQSF